MDELLPLRSSISRSHYHLSNTPRAALTKAESAALRSAFQVARHMTQTDIDHQQVCAAQVATRGGTNADGIDSGPWTSFTANMRFLERICDRAQVPLISAISRQLVWECAMRTQQRVPSSSTARPLSPASRGGGGDGSSRGDTGGGKTGRGKRAAAGGVPASAVASANRLRSPLSAQSKELQQQQQQQQQHRSSSSNNGSDTNAASAPPVTLCSWSDVVDLVEKLKTAHAWWISAVKSRAGADRQRKALVVDDVFEALSLVAAPSTDAFVTGQPQANAGDAIRDRLGTDQLQPLPTSASVVHLPSLLSTLAEFDLVATVPDTESPASPGSAGSPTSFDYDAQSRYTRECISLDALAQQLMIKDLLNRGGAGLGSEGDQDGEGEEADEFQRLGGATTGGSKGIALATEQQQQQQGAATIDLNALLLSRMRAPSTPNGIMTSADHLRAEVSRMRAVGGAAASLRSASSPAPPPLPNDSLALRGGLSPFVTPRDAQHYRDDDDHTISSSRAVAATTTTALPLQHHVNRSGQHATASSSPAPTRPPGGGQLPLFRLADVDVPVCPKAFRTEGDIESEDDYSGVPAATDRQHRVRPVGRLSLTAMRSSAAASGRNSIGVDLPLPHERGISNGFPPRPHSLTPSLGRGDAAVTSSTVHDPHNARPTTAASTPPAASRQRHTSSATMFGTRTAAGKLLRHVTAQSTGVSHHHSLAMPEFQRYRATYQKARPVLQFR